MPLHLLLGLRTSETPSAALQRRRTSPGISLKYRHCSFGFQTGPSVNRTPVQSFSTTAFLSTSRSNSGDFTSTESPMQISRLLKIQARPRNGHSQHVLDYFEGLIGALRRKFAFKYAWTSLSVAISGSILWDIGVDCQGNRKQVSLQSENVRFAQSRNVRFHGWPRAAWKRSA